MKRISVIIVLIAFFSSCNKDAKQFVGNVDNALMVGEWVISEVDNADALISKEILFLSILEDQYQQGNVFKFSEGERFELLSVKNEILKKGRYSIGQNDEVLLLLFEDGNHLLKYEIVKEGENIFRLNAKTSGELINLVIKK